MLRTAKRFISTTRPLKMPCYDPQASTDVVPGHNFRRLEQELCESRKLLKIYAKNSKYSLPRNWKKILDENLKKHNKHRHKDYEYNVNEIISFFMNQNDINEAKIKFTEDVLNMIRNDYVPETVKK